MAASKTLMNVKKAETAPALDRVLKVLGSEQMKETTAPIAAKPMVQTLCADPGQYQWAKNDKMIRTRHRVQIASNC